MVKPIGTNPVSAGKAEETTSPVTTRRVSPDSAQAAAAAAPIASRTMRKAPPPSLSAQLLFAIEDLSSLDAEKKQFEADNPPPRAPMHPVSQDIDTRRFQKKEQIKTLQQQVRTHIAAEKSVFLAFKTAMHADPEADLSMLAKQFSTDPEQAIYGTFMVVMEQPGARDFFTQKTEITATAEERKAHAAEREKLSDLQAQVHACQFTDHELNVRLATELGEQAEIFREENTRLNTALKNDSAELRNFQTEIMGQDGASLDRRDAMAKHFFQNSGNDYNIEDFRAPEGASEEKKARHDTLQDRKDSLMDQISSARRELVAAKRDLAVSSDSDVHIKIDKLEEVMGNLGKEITVIQRTEQKIFLMFNSAIKTDPKADLTKFAEQFQTDPAKIIYNTFIKAIIQKDARNFFLTKVETIITAEEVLAYQTAEQEAKAGGDDAYDAFEDQYYDTSNDIDDAFSECNDFVEKFFGK